MHLYAGGFSIPPPTVSSCHGGWWEGLDNAVRCIGLFFTQTRTDTVWLQAWGSHVFFSIVAYINRARSADSWWGRPMILSKFGKPDWRPGMDSRGHAESPAQHRYPVRAPLSLALFNCSCLICPLASRQVWWTGDYVDLQASVESMVDSGNTI